MPYLWHFRHKESTFPFFYSLVCLPFFLNLSIKPPFPPCSVTNASLLSVWSHPVPVDLHPHTLRLPHPPSFFSSSVPLSASLSSLFSLAVCLSIPFSLCLSLFLPQTAATVIWSSPRCGTSRRAWTSCRLRPSSPGRSFNLSTEALRMYVRLLRHSSLLYLIIMLYIDLNWSNIHHFFLPLWSRSAPVGWLMRIHSRPSILSSFPKEVRHYKNLSSFYLFRDCMKIIRGGWDFNFSLSQIYFVAFPEKWSLILCTEGIHVWLT